MHDPFTAAQVRVRRRKLPHWTLDGATYFVTFRLVVTPLSEPERRLVRDHIVAGNARFYHLSAAAVMPDHVHLLLRPADGFTLSRVLQGLKSESAKRLNAHRGTNGRVWQAESWDRIVRDEAEFEEKYGYMLGNPVKAGLCADGVADPGWWSEDGSAGHAGVLSHRSEADGSVGQDSGLSHEAEGGGSVGQDSGLSRTQPGQAGVLPHRDRTTAEVVTFGEAMIRLTPPGCGRLERATSFGAEVGGAELNTAAGLVRLGHPVAWVSRLPDSPLGRLVLNRVRESGVEARAELAADGRCGLYFLEEGAAPRASGIVYDRAGSSFALQPPDAFDWPRLLSGAKWFHVTGITPALGDNPLSATRTALKVAKALGLTTSIDLNYRAKLWVAAAAGRAMSELLADCDVLIAGVEDAALLFGVTGADFAAVARQLVERFGLRAVAGVKREAPRVWFNRYGGVGVCDGVFHETPLFDCEVVDRLGAGDAFAAGLIHGMLAGDFRRGLEVGAAFGALKHTVRGDLPVSDLAEVEAVLAGGGLRVKR